MASFDWTEYLKNNNSVAIPESFFAHVENSLSNGIKEGMIFEVCYKTNPDVYWLGKVTMACGHLLRVKLLGAESDFWCDITNIKGHSIGWCPKNDELIEPPADIAKKYGNSIIDIMRETVSTHELVSDLSLDNKGLAPIDRIKQGMKVEVQDTINPYRYWIATIQENVGGRLLLSYDEAEDDLPKFWIFYSNSRLASFGFVTNKGSPWHFKYPGKVNRFACRNRLSALLRVCAEESIKDPTPHDLFGPNNMPAHNFADTMKVEALDPVDMKTIRPATVVIIYNNYEFLVVIDDHRNDYQDTRMAWICHSMHPYIYPLGWAQKNSVPFTVPKIWNKETFDWDEYLSMTSSVPAPEYCFGTKESNKEITENMMLEAVNPLNHDEIHVARVKSVVEHMICVELFSTGECHWYAQNSDLLFPVGWCDSNNYELHIPNVSMSSHSPHKPLEVEKEEIKLTEEWCDRIFFNYKCYAGPMISRNKLSQLPKHVGPGPLSLVLKEVLNKIISASYKPAKLLRDWETEGPAAEGMRLEILKAKLKTSTYYASVEIATSSPQIQSFCRSMCTKLQSCPHLFGPNEYAEQCPESCQQVDKSKFHNISEKRGRPRGSKKKKKKGTSERTKGLPLLEAEVGAEGGESLESEHSGGSSPRSESATRANSPDSLDYKKLRLRRKPKNEYPKLEMKTRGAKLPNFALQIKEAHWDRKDMETIYSNTCIPKKQSPGSDTENESSRSSNSRDAKHIYDVSDSEEPELKKLKFTSDEPQPTDNKIFEKNISMPWLKEDLKLPSNPLDWSISDVYTYLSNTEDCKLIAEKMRQEEIDGQAFIMLDLPTVKEFLHIRREFALKLCRHISMLKWYYVVNFEDGVVET